MRHSVSRRSVIQAAAALAVVGIGGADAFAASSSGVTINVFMSLSKKLTGHEGLDQEMGALILKAFIEAGRGAELASLVSGAADTAKIANDVVAAWYSGFSPVASATEVTGFNSALVWDALSYTKPWGNCGGETGYWANPPTG